jgi:hypothetical protein
MTGVDPGEGRRQGLPVHRGDLKNQPLSNRWRFFRQGGLTLLAAVCWGWCSGAAWAHVSDTSLLRIRIEPERISVEWDADLVSLQRIRPLRTEAGGVVTRRVWEEDSAALGRWIGSLLELRVDGGASDLGSAREAVWESESAAVPEGQWQGAHVKFGFERARGGGQGVIQFSAARLLEGLGPRHSLIAAFVEGDQSEQVVLSREFPGLEYRARVAESSSHGNSPGASWLGLLRLGTEHILSGYDHLLFLVTLLVAARGWRRLVAIITAFTVAHGVTLTLSALEWVRLPDRWVECTIALSIVWVAVENLVAREVASRWLLTFGFGLVHGLGFAGALRELQLPREGLLGSVLSFNLGVEAGQLLFVAAMFPVLWFARGAAWERAFQRSISALAGLLAAVWFVQRWIE